jgi:predicted amidohydrolase
MIVAAYQMTPALADAPANVAAIAKAAEAAAARGARILVAPELATTGYGAGDAIRALAEPVDGAQIGALTAAAKRADLAIVVGFAERDGADLYNAAAFITPQGQVTVHRKRFLYGPYEKSLFKAAPDLSAPFRFEDAVVGMRICFDVEFPESVRALTQAGADLILTPTALPNGPAAGFTAAKLVPTRAFENGVTVVYVNHAGRDPLFSYAGLSVIAFADGTEGGRAGSEGEALLVAEIDPAVAAAARVENDYLGELATLSLAT